MMGSISCKTVSRGAVDEASFSYPVVRLGKKSLVLKPLPSVAEGADLLELASRVDTLCRVAMDLSRNWNPNMEGGKNVTDSLFEEVFNQHAEVISKIESYRDSCKGGFLFEFLVSEYCLLFEALQTSILNYFEAVDRAPFLLGLTGDECIKSIASMPKSSPQSVSFLNQTRFSALDNIYAVLDDLRSELPENMHLEFWDPENTEEILKAFLELIQNSNSDESQANNMIFLMFKWAGCSLPNSLNSNNGSDDHLTFMTKFFSSVGIESSSSHPDLRTKWTYLLVETAGDFLPPPFFNREFTALDNNRVEALLEVNPGMRIAMNIYATVVGKFDNMQVPLTHGWRLAGNRVRIYLYYEAMNRDFKDAGLELRLSHVDSGPVDFKPTQSRTYSLGASDVLVKLKQVLLPPDSSCGFHAVVHSGFMSESLPENTTLAVRRAFVAAGKDVFSMADILPRLVDLLEFVASRTSVLLDDKSVFNELARFPFTYMALRPFFAAVDRARGHSGDSNLSEAEEGVCVNLLSKIRASSSVDLLGCLIDFINQNSSFSDLVLHSMIRDMGSDGEAWFKSCSAEIVAAIDDFILPSEVRDWLVAAFQRIEGGYTEAEYQSLCLYVALRLCAHHDGVSSDPMKIIKQICFGDMGVNSMTFWWDELCFVVLANLTKSSIPYAIQPIDLSEALVWNLVDPKKMSGDSSGEVGKEELVLFHALRLGGVPLYNSVNHYDWLSIENRAEGIFGVLDGIHRGVLTLDFWSVNLSSLCLKENEKNSLFEMIFDGKLEDSVAEELYALAESYGLSF